MELEDIRSSREAILQLSKYKSKNIKQYADVLNGKMLEVLDSFEEKKTKEKPISKYEYERSNPEADISRINDALNRMFKLYKQAYEEVGTLDRKTQDLLHEMELTELSDNSLLEISKEITDIRQRRRLCKDYREITEPLYKFLNANPYFMNDLKDVQRSIQRDIEKKNIRTYTRREPTALEVAMAKAKNEK